MHGQTIEFVPVATESSTSVATESFATIATATSSLVAAAEAFAVEDPRILVVREIQVAMSMGPRTYVKFMKLVELNADVHKYTDFTVHMYWEDGKDIESVHNVTQLDPSDEVVLLYLSTFFSFCLLL